MDELFILVGLLRGSWEFDYPVYCVVFCEIGKGSWLCPPGNYVGDNAVRGTVPGTLSRAIQSVWRKSEICVLIWNTKLNTFSVGVRLRISRHRWEDVGVWFGNMRMFGFIRLVPSVWTRTVCSQVWGSWDKSLYFHCQKMVCCSLQFRDGSGPRCQTLSISGF